MTPAGFRHGSIAMTIGSSLKRNVEANRLGTVLAAETGFLLGTDPDHVRAPDAALVCRERVEAAGDVAGFWPGAPDLAVEVISPGDTYGEVDEKVLDWLEAGTRMVLVADPRRRVVTVYRSLKNVCVLTDEDTLDGADVVPGWSLPLREIFA